MEDLPLFSRCLFLDHTFLHLQFLKIPDTIYDSLQQPRFQSTGLDLSKNNILFIKMANFWIKTQKGSSKLKKDLCKQKSRISQRASLPFSYSQ